MSSIRPPPRNSISHKVEMLGNMQSSERFHFLHRKSHHLGVTRAGKFSNLSSITLFIPASQGAENTQIYYVGFLGSWTEVSQYSAYLFFRRFSSPFQHKNKPIITVYESQANLADHEKIQGLDGTFSAPGY
jgi:PITH domain